MSRRFALALIAVVLIQFCSVYAWQSYERKVELNKIAASLTVTHGMAIANLEELLNQQVMGYEEMMLDESKGRFLPLLHFVKEHHVGYQNLYATEDQNTFPKNSMALIKLVAKDYKEMMVIHHKDIDLREDDAVVKCAKMDDLMADALASLSKIPTRLNPGLRSEMARIVTLDYIMNTLMDAMSLCGGKATIMDSFFPVFNADRCAYQAGDALNARVSVGSYSSSLNPKNIVLTIDGKEYPIGPDGTAKFQTSESKRGEHTVKTRVVVTNPLTGEVQSGEGSFTYRVY
jgi:hypothetical protein